MLIGYDPQKDNEVVFAIQDPVLLASLEQRFKRPPQASDFVDLPLETVFVDDSLVPDLDQITSYRYVDGSLIKKKAADLEARDGMLALDREIGSSRRTVVIRGGTV